MTLVRKTRRTSKTWDDTKEAPIPVLLRTKPGHSDDEIVDTLTRAGALNVEILVPGFISAEAKPSTLEAIEDLASVHPKRLKQIRY